MAADEPGSILRSPRADQRRSNRFPVVVPVQVQWRGLDGGSLKEEARAKEVNSQGGLLQMSTYPPVGCELELTNSVSAEAARARVMAVRRSRDGEILGVAVELVVPSETFWGLGFRLKRTSAELLQLEQVLKSGDIDPRMLREFRDAVDYVRKTAWAVQEWQERQLQRRDAHTVLSLLTAERIRRGAQLSNDLAADLETGEVTRNAEGIAELYDAAARLYKRLGQLFH